MDTGTKPNAEKMRAKRYKIQHSINEYTFPKEAYIHNVSFDEKYMRVELTDGRILSIPLWWIPTVFNASEEDRKKFEINQSRTMIIWNPAKCGINDEISIADYIGPTKDDKEGLLVYASREAKRQVAEGKARPVKK